ncbi:MAG: hypothetical protein LRY43_01850 [Gammaproteobacteria bacterium]|nr:hypothetical protein [Gammaproteobacteria bacterium]
MAKKKDLLNNQERYRFGLAHVFLLKIKKTSVILQEAEQWIESQMAIINFTAQLKSV